VLTSRSSEKQAVGQPIRTTVLCMNGAAAMKMQAGSRGNRGCRMEASGMQQVGRYFNPLEAQ
jgi:hypothetical protein